MNNSLRDFFCEEISDALPAIIACDVTYLFKIDSVFYRFCSRADDVAGSSLVLIGLGLAGSFTPPFSDDADQAARQQRRGEADPNRMRR